MMPMLLRISRWTSWSSSDPHFLLRAKHTPKTTVFDRPIVT